MHFCLHMNALIEILLWSDYQKMGNQNEIKDSLVKKYFWFRHMMHAIIIQTLLICAYD